MYLHKPKYVLLSIVLFFICTSLLFINCNNTPHTYTVNIVNATITVYAGQYNHYQVDVTSTMDNPRLIGSFTASGGSGNDIKVYVMDNTNYVNWSNGHSSTAYYSSGQTTTGSFNVSFTSSGTYYVVYDNSFSVVSDKQVTTNVNLKYEAQ